MIDCEEAYLLGFCYFQINALDNSFVFIDVSVVLLTFISFIEAVKMVFIDEIIFKIYSNCF